MSEIYIGPAGWSYPDWHGVVYPAERPKGFSELNFLSNYFNTVEINSSFYRIPSVKNVNNWVNQIKHHPSFMFCVKLWQNFTHTEMNPASQQTSEFRNALEPMLKENRLGALLIQFPWRFKLNDENLAQLNTILSEFHEFPCAVEFRHNSWIQDKVFDTLAEHRCAFVNIDQPVIGDSIPPTAKETSSIGYVRFHGRNYANWFKEGSGRDARYDYLYQKDEIDSWMENIRKIAEQTLGTFIIFNNHFRGQAVVNALQLDHMLTGKKVPAPSHLVNVYHSLDGVAVADDAGQTLNLF